MSKALMLMAEGFEEVEALTSVDLLRRAGTSVTMMSITGDRMITGRSGITVLSDCVMEAKGEELAAEYDAVILPGGLPNAYTLRDSECVRKTVKAFNDAGKIVSAICAAPCVLESIGLLAGKTATSYPGEISEDKCNYVTSSVAVDGNIVTSRGVGTAIDFALMLASILEGQNKAEKVAKAIIYR